MTPLLRGAALMAIAAGALAVDTVIIRIVAKDIHPFEIGFFRNLFSLLVLAPWLARVGPAGLMSSHMPIHFARAMLKLAAIICFFYAVKILPLAAVTAIAFAAPLFVSLGAIAFLGEKPHLRRLLALLVGFVGVLIVIRPGTAFFDPAMILAVAAAIGLGGVGLMLKFLSTREAPATVVSLNLLITVPVALLVALPVWTTPGPAILLLLVVQGVLGAIVQLCVSRAMSLGDASVLAPLEFLRLPLVAVLAWLTFGETSDIWTLVGGIVIFSATIGLVRREHGRQAGDNRLPP